MKKDLQSYSVKKEIQAPHRDSIDIMWEVICYLVDMRVSASYLASSDNTHQYLVFKMFCYRLMRVDI